MSDPHYDIILAGGGVAGLTLAHYLVNSPLRDRSILIVDEEVKDRNDVTLSFWADRPTPFDDIVYRAWDAFNIVSDGGYVRTLDLRQYRYKTIRGIDFYYYIQQALAALPNVTMRLGTVDRVEDRGDHAAIVVEGQTFTGGWVFDSLFEITRFAPDTTRYRALQQHFKGLEIETATPHFDPALPTFFDFRTPQEGELRFYYVLPYSERHALIEYVVLSRTKYEQDLREHIADVMGIKDYITLNEEGGISPLTNYPFRRRAGRRIMNIGIKGGMIQPSTGYAFIRILDDSAAIIASLLRHGHPFDVPSDSWFYRMCDWGCCRSWTGAARG
ncbi:MAG: lycopene cyclase family protein [Anaerolineae bacterium]|nr:lycopene cyclase family protein [Anaerolineae bacterium]